MKHFPQMFETDWRHIKVRRSTRFYVCKVCEDPSSTLKNAIVHKRPVNDIGRREKAHMTMVSLDRL